MIPSLDQAAAQGWNVCFWAFDQQVNPGVKWFVYLVVFVAQLLCGLATVTSASRMIFAFSRDGGLPGSKALSKVSPTYRTPVAAIWTGPPFGALRLGHATLVSIAGTSAYTIVVSCTVIFLFLSFTFPIVLGLLAWGTPKWDKMGPWNMGRGVSALRDPVDDLDDPDLHDRRAAAERLGALHHRRLLRPHRDRLVAFENRRFKGPPIGE